MSCRRLSGLLSRTQWNQKSTKFYALKFLRWFSVSRIMKQSDPALDPPGIDRSSSNMSPMPAGTDVPHSATKIYGIDCSLMEYRVGHPPCLGYYSALHDKFRQCRPLSYRLGLSWKCDALMTLKIICYLKDTRYTRKFHKEEFFGAALWLHKFHPKTLANNVETFSKFGSLKDLLEILYRLQQGPQDRKKVIEMRSKTRGRRSRKLVAKRMNSGTHGKKGKEKGNGGHLGMAKRAEMAGTFVEKYKSDSDYRFLYDQIADVFAKLLKSDIQFLDAGEIGKISLASKWCPSLYSRYDCSILFCENVARRLFPYDSSPEYEGLEEAHYVHRISHRLQTQVLVPLRRALGLSDNGVPKKAPKSLFFKHNPKRLMEYHKNGFGDEQQNASTGCMLPYKILNLLDHEDGDKLANLHWGKMVDVFSEKENFRNCISICLLTDCFPVLPVEFCTSFSLLISSLSKGLWKGKVINFNDANPQLVTIDGDDFRSRIECLKRVTKSGMTGGSDTSLIWKILEIASSLRLPKDDMVKKVYFLHDMCSSTHFFIGATCGAFWSAFQKHGYAFPHLVSWCMNEPMAVPIVESYEGLTTITGYSDEIFKRFLEDGGVLDPQVMMESHMPSENYKRLVVYD